MTQDFDGDGTSETFAAAGDSAETLDLWYSKNGEAICLQQKVVSLYRQKLEALALPDAMFALKAESDGGSGTTSTIYFVQKGAPRASALSGRVMQFRSGKHGEFIIDESCFDLCYFMENGQPQFSGHTYKPYWFYYDAAAGDFAEYLGTPIFWEDLSAWPGAQELVNAQQEQLNAGIAGTATAKYVRTNLYRRDNGVINVNFASISSPGTRDEGGSFANCTLRVNDGAPYVEDGDLGGEGYYRTSYFAQEEPVKSGK